MSTFPCYRVEGDHRQLGRSHGEQAAMAIQAHLEAICRHEGWSRQSLSAHAAPFVPLWDRHCPHLVEELQGLADGARISLLEAVAVNTRSVLSTADPAAGPHVAGPKDAGPKDAGDGCTSFGVLATYNSTGHVIAGQNSDMLPETETWCYVLHLQPIDRPEILIWTFGGMIGYHGFNSAGVANFANDLGGGPARRFGMPHYPLKRLILECRDLDEVEARMRSFPVAVNANYVLADRQGVIDIEITPEGLRTIQTSNGYVAHANHFVCQPWANEANHAQSADDSFVRLERMGRLMDERAGTSALTVDDLQNILRDREGAPTAICRTAVTRNPDATWETAGITVASLIAIPAERRMLIARGPDPAAEFVSYSMDGDPAS